MRKLFTGVWRGERKRYRAALPKSVAGRVVRLGSFGTDVEAAFVVDVAREFLGDSNRNLRPEAVRWVGNPELEITAGIVRMQLMLGGLLPL